MRVAKHHNALIRKVFRDMKKRLIDNKIIMNCAIITKVLRQTLTAYKLEITGPKRFYLWKTIMISIHVP